jgi:hypothetical protein
MDSIKVEIGQYKEVNKGTSLKGFFSLVIYPQAQKILDCRYFENGDQRWFAFPQKEVKYSDGRKTEYIPLISYGDKGYLEQLKKAVLEALQKQGSNETQNRTVGTAPRKIPVQEPNDSRDLPF